MTSPGRGSHRSRAGLVSGVTGAPVLALQVCAGIPACSVWVAALLSWLPVMSAAAPAAAQGAELSKISRVYDWTRSSSAVEKHDLPSARGFA